LFQSFLAGVLVWHWVSLEAVAKFVAIVSSDVVVNKLEAALRQIETAAWLWFNEGDIVSIVTLSGAALGVLDELFQHHKKGRPIPFNDEMAPPGMTPKQARKLVKADETFAKHARNDAEKTRQYSHARAEMYLYCAIAAYNHFTGDFGPGTLRSLFTLRYGVINDAELFDPPRSTLQTPEQRRETDRLKRLSRAEFFKEMGGDFTGNPPRPDNWPDDR
jgi:hypothetical protein